MQNVVCKMWTILFSPEHVNHSYVVPCVFWTPWSDNIYKRRAYIDGLAQYCSNSSALAMELLQSCAEPSIRVKFLWLLSTHINHRTSRSLSVLVQMPQCAGNNHRVSVYRFITFLIGRHYQSCVFLNCPHYKRPNQACKPNVVVMQLLPLLAKTTGCHDDNLWRRQWKQGRSHDNSWRYDVMTFSVKF